MSALRSVDIDTAARKTRSGLSNALGGVSEYASKLPKSPKAVVGSVTRAAVPGYAVFAVAAVIVAFVWRRTVLNEDEEFGSLDAVSIGYLAVVLTGAFY